MISFRSFLFACALGMTLLIAVGCGQGELLSGVSASSDVITPNGDGTDDVLAINYTIGTPSKVSIFVEDSDGTRYPLRDQMPRTASNDPYTLRFDGTVPGTEPGVRQQVLPDGEYTWTVIATPTGGGTPQQQGGTFTVRDAADDLPTIEDLNVTPQFSPNEDAVDDVAYFTYRLPVTATVTIDFTDSTGRAIPFITELEEGPFEQSHIWEGKEASGALVNSGVYTYTITARDTVGNITEQTGQVEVTQPGRSRAQITFVDIAPVEVGLGDVITVTARIKNTGDVPIRTQGPASGYQYTTEETFASIEDNQYAEKGGGFWRFGLDWGGGRAYPFRWALSERPPEEWAEPFQYDYLQPGEEVQVTGSVEIKQREDRMQFYAGLIHEGVGYPVNNVGRTLICVGIPGIEDRCPRRVTP